MADGKAGTRGAISLRDVDPDALKVVRKLVAGGFEAYLVGGCVRDLYLKRRPKDFDVATSATPEAIRRTFRNCRIIGRRFKLAHVFFGPKVIETSTFRTTPIALLLFVSMSGRTGFTARVIRVGAASAIS